jgi:Methylamine utilisation protein MauE
MTVGVSGLFTGDWLSDLLTAARGIQLLVLAALLLGACAAKARRVISGHSLAAATGPTGMFPVRLRGPIAIALSVLEFALGAGLLITAGRIGAGPPALVIRSLTALLFGTAVAALYELRGRQPDAGCGCFGDLSHTPVSWRALARAAVLCLGGIATIGQPPLHPPDSARQAWLVLVLLAVELAVLAVLSPEIGEIMVRLGYSEPCEVRRLPVSRTLSALRGSGHWRRYRRYLTSEEPVDVWREGCWRYVVFPAMLASRRVEVVFAVYLKPRRAPVRAGIFDATADRRAREAAEGTAVTVAVPAPRKVPVSGYAAAGKPAPGQAPSGQAPSGLVPSGHAAPVMLSAQAHRASRSLPHPTPVHRVPHNRQRHSAGL